MRAGVRCSFRGALALGILLACLLSGTHTLWAQRPLVGISHPPDATAALLRTVDAHYNRLRSLRTRYSERYTGMGVERNETGTLLLRKPGRMLWRYDQPAGKVFVLDGKDAWFYTPGDTQATRAPAKELDDLRTPLRFLLGHTELAKELDSVSVTPEGGGFRIAGSPRGLARRVKQLTLRVTPGGQITGMQIDEIEGASTSFTFTGIEENVPTRDSDFTFAAPRGVTVVDALPPI